MKSQIGPWAVEAQPLAPPAPTRTLVLSAARDAWRRYETYRAEGNTTLAELYLETARSRQRLAARYQQVPQRTGRRF